MRHVRRCRRTLDRRLASCARFFPFVRGKDYRVVGNDIVHIEIATELVLDVMKDVLR